MRDKFGGFGAVILVVGLALFALVTFFVLKYSMNTNQSNNQVSQQVNSGENSQTTPNQPVATSSPLGDGLDSDSQKIDQKMNDLNTDLNNVDAGLNDKAITVQ
ncbi:MAG: hypothetical protein HY044_02045 [Candidatus Woesebacteria bacterium]|nr:MAG: hypothetical protein HY044_02045 [Candidatus Woesebacteria bacterium]